MANFEATLFEKNGGVAIIALDRLNTANGINLSMAKELLNIAIDCAHQNAALIDMFYTDGNASNLLGQQPKIRS